jgi:hypothetical protein
MRSGIIVIINELMHHLSQVALIEYYHAVKAFTPYGPDNSFRVSILPRSLKPSPHAFNAQCFKATVKRRAKHASIVIDKVLWSGIKRKSLLGLQIRPRLPRIFRYIEMEYLSGAMLKHNEAIENLEVNGNRIEEVYPCDLMQVVFQKCTPCLRRRFFILIPIHVSCNR